MTWEFCILGSTQFGPASAQDGEAYRREAGMQVLGGRWRARVEQLERETVPYQSRTELEQSKDRCAASLCSPLKGGARVRVQLVY